MIEFCKSYKVGDQVFATLAEAQMAELVTLWIKEEPQWANQPYVKDLAKHTIKHADKVIDILSTTASSRPKARKANGGTKKRKAKATGDGALADML